MAWLAKLDTRSQRWPVALRWPYLGLKWLLVALGTYGAIGLAARELHEGHVGLGTGIATATVLGIIKGILSVPRHR